MQKKLNRSYESLEEMYELTERFLLDEAVEPAVRFPVHFVMEELFTNMVKYQPENANDILLAINAAKGGVTVSLTDYDVDAFDVTRDRPAAFPQNSAARVGGRGWRSCGS